MLFFYIIFFWFLNNFSSIVAFNLKDDRSSLLSEFFFCLDSFSTTFIIFYIIIFFIFYDLILLKFLNLRIKSENYFYLNLRFFFIIIRKLILTVILFIWLKLKTYVFNLKSYLNDKFSFLSAYLGKNRLTWRPLFKRWSYFGLWSKKNNKN